jgi:hypothetical protein
MTATRIGLRGASRSRDRAAEPVGKVGCADTRLVAGEQGCVVDLSAEQVGVNVGDHLAWVFVRVQDASDELVETRRVGTGELDGAVVRRTLRDVGEGGGDIVGGDGHISAGDRRSGRFR